MSDKECILRRKLEKGPSKSEFALWLSAGTLGLGTALCEAGIQNWPCLSEWEDLITSVLSGWRTTWCTWRSCLGFGIEVCAATRGRLEISIREKGELK